MDPQHTFLRQGSKAEGPVEIIIIINNSVVKLITNKQSVQWRKDHPLIGVYILLPLQDDSEDQDYYFPLTLYDYTYIPQIHCIVTSALMTEPFLFSETLACTCKYTRCENPEDHYH
jgi:hypothetical protein